MKTFKETIHFHREKEDNWDISVKAETLGYKKEIANNLKYLGMEIEMEIEISEDGSRKVLEIDGVDVSDKEIYV